MTARAPRKDSLATRRRLIDAAERLFAARGIDNASLLDVARAAGQKNRNALQYHFGDKESLIHAVLDKHTEGIAQKRGEMLERLEGQAKPSLQEIVEALVLPVAAMLDDEDGGTEFLKINSQLMAAENYAQMRADRAQRFPEVRRFQKLLAGHLAGIGRKSVEARLLLMDCVLFHGLATYASSPSKISRKLFLRTLVASIAAILSEPG